MALHVLAEGAVRSIMMPNRYSHDARALLLLLLASLGGALGCSAKASSKEDAADLPAECTAFVAAYEACVSKPSPQAAAIAPEHAARARLGLLAEAKRGEAAIPALRAKCVAARERLTVSCR